MFRTLALNPWLAFTPLYNAEGGSGGGAAAQKKKLAALLDEDDDLQEEFNAIFEKRLAREKKKLTAKGGASAEDLAELETLRTAAGDRERADAERKAEYERALGLEREKHGKKETGWKTREDKLVSELRRDRVRSQLVAEAARQGAIDPEELADILERRVQFDAESFGVSVVDEKDTTKPALNGKGDEMDIRELVATTLAKKKHLAKAAAGDGSGARGGRSTSGEGAADGGHDEEAQDVKDLRVAYEKALEHAEKTRTPAAMTKMQQAKRRYDAALKKDEQAA